MNNNDLFPAITEDGIVNLKVGSLYQIFWRRHKTDEFKPHDDVNYKGPILILEIKRVNINSIQMPHLHDIKFLSLEKNEILIESFSGGGTDLPRFRFKELVE